MWSVRQATTNHRAPIVRGSEMGTSSDDNESDVRAARAFCLRGCWAVLTFTVGLSALLCSPSLSPQEHTPLYQPPQLPFSPGDPPPAAPPLEGAWPGPHLPACLWPWELPEGALAEGVWKLFLPVPFKSQGQLGHGAPEGAPCPPRLGWWRRGLPGSPGPAPPPLPPGLILQALKQP